MKKLPSYGQTAVAERQNDLNMLLNSEKIHILSNTLYGVQPDAGLSREAIYQFLNSTRFSSGADYFKSDELTGSLATLVENLTNVARHFGFPNRPEKNIAESKIDFSLSIALMEQLESGGFVVYPCHANSRLLQEFMTMRVFPLITYWRWKIVTGRAISPERVTGSVRNYFYTLWISAWLFDNGEGQFADRWTLLESMSSDSIVQVVERTGIGYRKGFAKAIAVERLKRSESSSGSVLDRLVRGCMKRATFTFSTSAMPDDEEYYAKISSYLFKWAEENYLPQVDDASL
jgi:hypothetical protein